MGGIIRCSSLRRNGEVPFDVFPGPAGAAHQGRVSAASCNFADNDATGKKHASQVGRSLVGKAASVRIGYVPAGKDVSDWISRGATKVDIQAAIEAATDFMKSAEAERSVEAVDWRLNLLTNEKGFPKALLANAITALRWAPEWAGVLGFNEFSLGTVALKAPPWQSEPTGKEWTDHEDRLAADVFGTKCVSCHTIDGDGGREGPDLTHAAKSRDRTAAWFRRWITDPGLVNPDAEMPAFGGKLSDAELTAIAEYLARRE